ncbi:putative ribonuclease H-like domain-containing protein, partial [Tanacetum coccineum]
EEGIDYYEVFAPVARIEAIRLFLAYASFKYFVGYQMGVKSVFLYGKIEEEAPRAWYETLSTYVLDNGFQRGTIDKTLFIKRHKGDILLVQMSSIGELRFFLGLQVQQKKDGIFISQDKYVDENLNEFGFTEVKTASTPIETQKPLLKDENGEEVDVHMYRYLKGQPKLGLWYPKDSPFDLVAYTDTDYARASLDRKSTTGEAEYVAASSCYGQVLWIQNQLLDYGYNFMHTKIFIDNNSTICIIRNSVFHSKTKHIEIRHYFIRDGNEKKLIQMVKIHTDKNVADLLTKAFDFLSTVKAKTINGEVQLQALVDGKKIIITESTMRRDLQLEDAEGVDYLPNATIFEQLALMGAKTTAWNKFSSTMESTIICLATNQKFNFSKYIFESMVKNLDNLSGKFLMYPRFVQVFLDKQLEGMSNHNRIYVTPSHTKKIFGNIRRVGKGFSGRETPLFQTMVVQEQAEMGEGLANPTDPYHTPTIIQPSPQPQKKQKSRKPKRKDTQIPQFSGPTELVADEAVYKELGDSLVRVVTTASSLEAEH